MKECKHLSIRFEEWATVKTWVHKPGSKTDLKSNKNGFYRIRTYPLHRCETCGQLLLIKR